MTTKAFNFSVSQLAERWDVSTRTVYSLCAAGQIGHIRVGKSIRIRPQDIEEYEARQWRGPVENNPDPGSPIADRSTTSAGGMTAPGTAFRLGQRIAARLKGSPPNPRDK
jgi:excisionase family DNA binding protein